jgi:hypothetical protein
MFPAVKTQGPKDRERLEDAEHTHATNVNFCSTAVNIRRSCNVGGSIVLQQERQQRYRKTRSELTFPAVELQGMNL